jgi:hypothetical protein
MENAALTTTEAGRLKGVPRQTYTRPHDEKRKTLIAT